MYAAARYASTFHIEVKGLEEMYGASEESKICQNGSSAFGRERNASMGRSERSKVTSSAA